MAPRGAPILRALAAPLLLLLSSAMGAPASATDLPQLVISAPASLERPAARVRAIEPERFRDAMRLVGLEDAGPPIQVFLGPEDSDLARGVPPWVSGYAYGDQGVIVLLPARTPAYPDSSLEELLRHEVAHVLVARAAGGYPLPRWFHEGVAMIAGSSWGFDDRSRLTVVMVGGTGSREVSLAEIEEQFRGGRGSTANSYAVAGAFVNDLLRREGDGAVAAILAETRKGSPFEDAFQEATGTPLAEAERTFWRRQSFWYRWMPILTSSVTLWMLITLLAIWAMARRRARDAALRAGWEAEENRLAGIEASRPEPGEWVN